ncbi:uncharacterized protein JCM10292_003022 [Rhodotorula paludigena]|uniref:uncharacterized protein n=1 Tax=Rhodotorula paludigena TaxID=86838 RepID=UPI00317C64D6
METAPRSGHSYFGIVGSAQEAQAILEACKLGILPRVTRRLTDEERLRFVRAGAVFVWEEEEAGIRRWTDHIKWSPSRVSGAFLTYTEVPAKEDDTLIKQSFSSVDASGTKMHLIAYTSKAAQKGGSLPRAARDPLVQHMLAQRNPGGRDPRSQPGPPVGAGQSHARPPDPSSHATPAVLQSAPLDPPRRSPLYRSRSTVPDYESRPHSSSSAPDMPRPLTSASEPQPSSAYNPIRDRPATTTSRSYPSLPQTCPPVPPTLGAPTPQHPSPLSHSSPTMWSFAYDPSRQSSSHFSSQRESPTASASPIFPSASYRPSTASTSIATSASGFDPSMRQLPPLEQLEAAGLPGMAGESPPRLWSSHGTFPGAPSEEQFAQGAGTGGGDEWVPSPRLSGRGAEDERQLRLLGRPF